MDGQTWPKSFSGEFTVNDKAVKYFSWIEVVEARFMKVEFLTELGDKTYHAVVAEIGVAEIEPPIPLPPPAAPTGLKIAD